MTDFSVTKEWFEKRATAEGDHEIGVGGNRKTMTINLTDAEIAELQRLANPGRETIRAEALEQAARLIDENIIMDTSGGKTLAPRQEGNREGQHYAAAIRALASQSPQPISEGLIPTGFTRDEIEEMLSIVEMEPQTVDGGGEWGPQESTDGWYARLLRGVLTSGLESTLKDKLDHAEHLQRLFDVQWKRTREAGELWRQAHPGNDLVNPDLGELVTWLVSFQEKPEPGADPIDAIKALMEERGLTNVDLYDVFGAKSRTSEIMRRKRPLRVHHIRKLHERFGLPLAKLVEAYQLDDSASDIQEDGDDA